MSTASWTSASVAPAACAAATSAAVRSRGSRRTVRAMWSSARILSSKPSDDPSLTTSTSGTRSVAPPPFEQRGRERAVRVHAVEAVVRRGDGGREHLALGAFERGAREVVDQQLVGEAAQVDAEPGRQPDRGQDPGDIGQAADDGLFLRAREALFVACHRHRLPAVVLSPRMRHGSARHRQVQISRGRDAPRSSSDLPNGRRTANVSANGAGSRSSSAPSRRRSPGVTVPRDSNPMLPPVWTPNGAMTITWHGVESVVRDDASGPTPRHRGAGPASPRAGRRDRRP